MNAKSKEYLIDSPFTSKVKNFALKELNADLVGVANIERFANAPEMMSPQGIMPHAKSVIVMAVTHTDGCVEMGGIKHPQEIGPYNIQYYMNTRIDEISYKLALWLEDHGVEAIPIVSSNIWRYKGYKDLKEHFAPDISHMHAAVAAGLAEFGYNGLAITPEFGAHNRYASVITTAELTPTPLIEPGSVCDNCMICKKHCLSGALSKEIDGWNIVKIEDKEYRYAKKNLWRCAWGEHFDLDLDLPIPEKVTEEVLLENVKKHGFRAGEMGSCLRYCVPKNLRYFDKNYTNAPRRKKHVVPAEGIPVSRQLLERVRSAGAFKGTDFTVIKGAEFLSKLGIDVKTYLPDAKTAVISGIIVDKREENSDTDIAVTYSHAAGGYLCVQTSYDISRELERNGFSTVTSTAANAEVMNFIKGIPAGKTFIASTVFTSAELPETASEIQYRIEPGNSKEKNTVDIKEIAEEAGADLTGIAPSSRFDSLYKSLEPAFGKRELLVAKDKSMRFYAVEPEITTEERKLLRPEDHLKGAKSVIVMGLRIPKATMEATARNKAESIGIYAYAQYESAKLLRIMALKVKKALEKRGFSAVATHDLMNTASVNGNPRGEQPDAFSNRFAALASGLGRLSKCGSLVTKEFGPNIRFIAVVTNAELVYDKVSTEALTPLCKDCSRCLKSCSSNAFNKGTVKLDLEGIGDEFHVIDQIRCDWNKRYSLSAEEGNMFLGWKLDEKAPENITAEDLDKAMRKQPTVAKYRPCNFEKCVLSCPYTRTQI